jgi:futalosine hydrolase
MRSLIVAATEQEIAPLLRAMKFRGDIYPQLRSYQHKEAEVDVLITGIGMVATAAWVSRVLTQNQYSCSINAGICGSFDRGIALGEVLRVQTDCIPELGAEDDQQFLPAHEMGLLDKNEFPFQNAVIRGSEATVFGSLIELKAVSGITVNKVHGNETSIANVVERLKPQVESMEGAGFLYACAIAGVPGIQVRAVSNYVEKRNRHSWKIEDAIRNLNAELLKYIEQ